MAMGGYHIRQCRPKGWVENRLSKMCGEGGAREREWEGRNREKEWQEGRREGERPTDRQTE